MSRLRRALVLLPAAGLLLAAALPAQAALPETVVIHDSRTSSPVVDISTVRLQASYYYDSEQAVSVTVPHGYRAGHLITVWFDLNGDNTPDGHFEMRLLPPKNAGGQTLRKVQEFRRGGDWGHGGTRVRNCGGSEGGPPVFDTIKKGTRSFSMALDLWYCVGFSTPNIDVDPGAWRVAVRVAKGTQADMAPNGQTWSTPVRGWAGCHDEC
jgi:hypothetical protein